MLFKNEMKKIWIQKQVHILIMLVLAISMGTWYFSFSSVEKNSYSVKEFEQIRHSKSKKEVSKTLEQLKIYGEIERELLIPNVSSEETNIDANMLERYEQYILEHDLNVETNLYQDLHTYQESIKDYHQYVNQVKENIGNVKSMAAWNDYSKTKQNYYSKLDSLYTDLLGNKITASNFHQMELLINSNLSYLLVFVALVLAYTSFTYDEQEGIYDIVLSTEKGRWQTTLAKISAISISIVILVMFSFASVLLMNYLFLGPIDFTAPVQSIPSLYTIPYPISIGLWLLLSVFYQIIGTIALALLFSAIYYFIRHEILSIIAYFILVGFSFLSIILINPNSSLAFLRYLNPLSTLHDKMLIAQYQIFDIFKISLNQSISSVFISIFLIVIAIFLIMLKRSHISDFDFTLKLKLDNLYVELFSKMKLVAFEFYKIFWLKKGVLVFLVVILIHFNILGNISKGFTNQEFEHEMAQYFKEHGGKLTESKRDWIEKTKEDNHHEFIQLKELEKEKNDGLIPEEDYMNAFVDYFNRQEERQKFDILYDALENKETLIYSSGYEVIFSIQSNQKDQRNSIIMGLAIVLFVAPIIAQDKEREMEHLFKLTKRGYRQSRVIKLAITLGISIMYIILISLLEVYMIHQIYPMSDWNTKMFNIMPIDFNLNNLWVSNISLKRYLMLLIFTRSIGAMFVVAFTSGVSKISKNVLQSYLISLAVFLLPILFKLTGNSIFNQFTIDSLLMGNTFIYSSFNLFYILFIVMITLALFTYTLKKD